MQLLHAQTQGVSGLDSVILKLFGNHDNFTVDSDFDMTKAKVTLTMGISVSGGKLRTESDLGTCKGAGMTDDFKALIQEAQKRGLSQVVKIVRPDQNRIIRLYPVRKAYDEAPLPKAMTADTGITKPVKTPLARETIDGHPCVKNKVVITSAKGAKQELIAWEATDLKDFPIKVQIAEGNEILVVHNRNICLAAPSPTLFEVPAGYSKLKQ